MTKQLKKIFLKTIFVTNITCALFLLVSNLAPVINPVILWPIGLLGILFPLLLLATFIYLIFWLFIQPKKSSISILVILISIPNIIPSFAFNLSQKFKPVKQSGNIRVVSWNVELMNYNAKDSMTAIKNNAVILKELHDTDADIICLQEFFSAIVPGNHYNLMDSISRTMGYPYYYFSKDYPKFNEKYYSGSIIFSRYKIYDTVKTVFPGLFAGSIIKTGIIINTDTVDIFTTRLQSVRFLSNEYIQLHNIKNGSDSAFIGSKNIIRKLKNGYRQRAEQANTVNKLIAQSTRPVIFAGDLNDVPVSYTYSKVKENLSDAWINKGSGIGRTFKFISPTLRIDHIFYNKFFNASQTNLIITRDASDHFGLISDLFLIKKEQ